jgi:hypothetical protein
MKHLLYVFLFFSSNVSAQANSSFKQLTFKDLPEIASIYEISNRPDSSVLLIILNVPEARRELFVLTKQNDNWSSGYFVKNEKTDSIYRELEIKSEHDSYLWKSLRMKHFFTIPNSNEIKDAAGQPITLDVRDGVSYHFKILTSDGQREFAYQSPEIFMREYPGEPAYRNVVALIRLVYSFCGIIYRY